MSIADAARTTASHPPPVARTRLSRQRGASRARRPVLFSRGFTLVEILCAIAILVILMAIAVPTIAKVRAAQRRTTCVMTLRQIAGALRAYASDNGMRFPDPGNANLSWEQMLMRYFPGPYACPADSELSPAVGSSYDWRDTGDSTTTLAGRYLGDVTRSDTVLAFEALPGWHTRGKVNAARADESVLTMDSDECFEDLKKPPNQSSPTTSTQP